MATAAVSSGAPSRRDMFASVFPPTNFTTPTPETTPNIGVLASPERPFGGFNVAPPAVDNTVRFNRAWSTATRRLTLPLHGSTKQPNPQIGHDVKEAMNLLCQDVQSRKELLAWYANETSIYYRHHVLPKLSDWQQSTPRSETRSLLARTMTLLDEAQEYCLRTLTDLVNHAPNNDARMALQIFRATATDRLHVQVLQSLPLPRLQDALADVFCDEMKASLNDIDNPEACLKRGECHCSLSESSVPFAQLYELGLGGAVCERAFAQAMHTLLKKAAIERRCFKVDWSEQSTVVPMLRRWIHAYVSPFVTRSLAALTGNASLEMSGVDADRFAPMAVSNLGRRRISAVFDYVKSWPASTGAFLDIQEYLACTPQDKAHLCDSFIRQAKQRLLHAGASTPEILSIYINVIHAFRLLDARGVLLEKVAGPMRGFLRGRDDTVAIIAASFLADVDQDGNVIGADMEKVCADITIEVANSTLAERREHRLLNYDDMTWVPDPIDAAPDFKASSSADVLAYVLGLFDPEDFIKEATTVLAQHLLQATDPEYVKETKLIELFKSRLEATKLQAAEVMLKDVRDSVNLNKRINPDAKFDNVKPPAPREIQAAIPEDGITVQSLYKMFKTRMKQAQFHAALKVVANKRNDLYFAKRTRLPPEPPPSPRTAAHDLLDFSVQVLSSFFWPQMRANEFVLPPDFIQREIVFENCFLALGNQRKLQFRHALARADVELELEDRQVRETDVPAWRASVIHAFATKHDDPKKRARLDYDSDAGLTAEQLVEALQMGEALVLDSLVFWTGKRVLYQKASGSYAVLESLDMDTGTAHQQAQQQTEGISAVKTQDAMLRESAPMFEAFIANMLRNGGPKEVGGMMGITNMLKMVLPLFTYGEEETRWLLEQMERQGEVMRNGDVWAVQG